VAEIEQVIHNLEQLYQLITGRAVIEGEGQELTIPPEKSIDQHMSEQLDRVLRALDANPTAMMAGRNVGWSPPFSASESPNEIRISVDLPGVSRDDLKVSVDHSIITVEGTRKLPVNGSNNTQELVRHVEQPHGVFRRHIPLPDGIAQDKLSARMTDGVLDIRVPRTGAEATARTISIG
jgi:HSP20 family protein